MARAVSHELKSALKRLRLGMLTDTLAERIAMAEKEHLPMEDFLLMILTDEIEHRPPAESVVRYRCAGARKREASRREPLARLRAP